jgi:hypothetical protein
MARARTRSRKPTDLKKIVFPVAFFVLLLFSPQSLLAQVYGSSFHTVTVTVATVNIVQVSSGAVSLTIDAGNVVAGVDLMGPVQNSTTSLLWGFNSANRKVTVETNLAAPNYILKVLCVAPTQGNPAPEVTLSTTGVSDFLTNAGRSSGTCTIQYSGYALASKGFGLTDTHTITFTVAVQ